MTSKMQDLAHELGTELVMRVRRAVVYEALDRLQEKNEQVEKLLRNGNPILDSTLGDRFMRLYQQRSKLYNQMETRSNDMDTLFSMIGV